MLSRLEVTVARILAHQFSGGIEGAAVILRQLETAQVTSRDVTNYGFLTHFTVDRRLPPAAHGDGFTSWVRSDVGPDKCPLDFMLHIREGYAEMILAFSLDGGYGDLDLLTATFTEPRIFNPHKAVGKVNGRPLNSPVKAGAQGVS